MDSLLSELEAQYSKAKITQPNRLFYNQYRHRITITNNGHKKLRLNWHFYDALIVKFFDRDLRSRKEGEDINVFVNDLETARDVSEFATNFSKEFWISELSIDQKARTQGEISVPKVRAMGFQYRVYLKTGLDTEYSADVKQRLAKLFDDNRDQYRVGYSFRDWLNNSHRRLWTQKYFYVKNPSMMTFFQLQNADLVDKILQVVD